MRPGTILAAGAAFFLMASAIPASGREPLSKRSITDLVESLRHPNPVVRIEAVDELGRRSGRGALLPLLAALRDEEPDVRAHAAEALRVLGDERAVPFLSRALEDPQENVRCRALLALGDLAGKYVLPAVRRMLADPSVVVRAAAVRALGEIGDPLSLDRVLKTLAESGDSADRTLASAGVIAAAKIGGVEGLGRAVGIVEEDLPKAWFLRASLAHATGLAGDRERIPLLVRYLREDEHPRVCQAAAGALARLGEQSPLLAALELPDHFRRQAAVGALGRMKGAVARTALMRATGDESPGVVLSAAAVLVEKGEAEALPILIGLLEGEAQIWLGALEVLETRTGMDFGRNPPRWREWFEAHRERIVFDRESGTFRAK